MSDLSEIVDSLENRISKMLHRFEKLKQQNSDLEKEMGRMKGRHLELQDEIDRWKEKCNALQMANSILGSDQYKRETKLKINALVREIDQCIAHLSD